MVEFGTCQANLTGTGGERRREWHSASARAADCYREFAVSDASPITASVSAAWPSSTGAIEESRS